MRKQFLLFILGIGSIGICYAQHADSSIYANCLPLKEKTFIIRKDSSRQKMPSTTKEKRKVEVGSEKTLVSNRSSQKGIQPPKLASDKKGLFYHMYLEPFDSRMVLPNDAKYVVFGFSISEQGEVDSIEFFDTNDHQLVDIIVYKLNYTLWNPAQLIDGTYTTYDYGKWIAIVSDSLNEKDYEQHRY